MRQYELLGFRTPYQVLLDAQLIKDAAKSKLNLGKLLQGALGGAEIKPMITQCCIRHLYNLTTSTPDEQAEKDGWIEVAKAAERRRCGHHELEEPLSTLECLLSVVDPKGSGNNRHRYVVASQGPEVRGRMREIVGVPLIYLKRSVMILEPMAEATERARDREERDKIRAGLKGSRGGVKRKREEDEERDVGTRDTQSGVKGDEVSETPRKKKVKGPKGPNPLSVKKPKKDAAPKRSVAREDEHETSALKKSTRTDPKASENGPENTTFAAGTHGNDAIEGSRKRKRKRKPADFANAVPEISA